MSIVTINDCYVSAKVDIHVPPSLSSFVRYPLSSSPANTGLESKNHAIKEGITYWRMEHTPIPHRHILQIRSDRMIPHVQQDPLRTSDRERSLTSNDASEVQCSFETTPSLPPGTSLDTRSILRASNEENGRAVYTSS